MCAVTERATRHPLQAIMSRTGSFPLGVAQKLLDDHCSAAAIVLDPFCGKGTSLLAARLSGKSAYGSDVAPEAVACARAKLADVNLAEVELYIRSLPVRRSSLDQVPDKVRLFFHSKTLQQIIAVRNRLLRDVEGESCAERAKASFVLGSLLGILHGHAAHSLSVPCAHAFSMSPQYVVRYCARHGITAIEKDVRECLVTKCRRVLANPLPKPVRGCVKMGSVTDIGRLFPQLRGAVDVILTSPPYLSAQTYAKDNWLRLWLLGYDYQQLQGRYIETSSIPLYAKLMKEAFSACVTMLRPGGRLICVAGDVRVGRDKSTTFQTARFLRDIVMEACPQVSLRSEGADVVESTSRYFHSLSKSNGHRRQRIMERYFVLQKGRVRE